MSVTRQGRDSLQPVERGLIMCNLLYDQTVRPFGLAPVHLANFPSPKGRFVWIEILDWVSGKWLCQVFGSYAGGDLSGHEDLRRDLERDRWDVGGLLVEVGVNVY